MASVVRSRPAPGISELLTGEAGWADFDPTNNMIPGVEHITFAWGRDYGDVSPINGVIVGGVLINNDLIVDARIGTGLNDADPDWFAGVGGAIRW